MVKYFSIFILILFNFRAVGQASTSVEKYFENIRLGASVDARVVIREEKSERVLSNAALYFRDSVQAVRSAAYRLIHLTGITSRESNVRQQTTQYLIQACSNKNDTDELVSYLQQFRKNDFDSVSKDSLQLLLKRESPPLPDLLKLAGYLEIHGLEKDIQVLTQPGNSQRVRWAALLALSRMGDAGALDNVLIRVRRLMINDDLVYDIFPDLIFTHQKLAIQFMVDVMNRSNKDCSSADAEQEVAIPCGYRIMEQLAPVIQGYPLKLDVSGDLKTKNYADALTTVRNWFDKHPEFVVINDTY